MSAGNTDRSEARGFLAALVRVFWLVGGNVLLFFLALSIAQRRGVSAMDLVYGATVASLIVARWIDIVHLGGETKDGEPATLQHWRRYVVMLLLAAGALWGLAHRALPRVLLP